MGYIYSGPNMAPKFAARSGHIEVDDVYVVETRKVSKSMENLETRVECAGSRGIGVA
jgi:hypothetical protein